MFTTSLKIHALLLNLVFAITCFAGKGKDGGLDKLFQPTEQNIGVNMLIIMEYIHHTANTDHLDTLLEIMGKPSELANDEPIRINVETTLLKACQNPQSCHDIIERIYDYYNH